MLGLLIHSSLHPCCGLHIICWLPTPLEMVRQLDYAFAVMHFYIVCTSKTVLCPTCVCRFAKQMKDTHRRLCSLKVGCDRRFLHYYCFAQRGHLCQEGATRYSSRSVKICSLLCNLFWAKLQNKHACSGPCLPAFICAVE